MPRRPSLMIFVVVFRLEFFNDLYHRFLLTTKPLMKAMCLQVSVILVKHSNTVRVC